MGGEESLSFAWLAAASVKGREDEIVELKLRDKTK